jgi:hypothetical protein
MIPVPGHAAVGGGVGKIVESGKPPSTLKIPSDSLNVHKFIHRDTFLREDQRNRKRGSLALIRGQR